MELKQETVKQIRGLIIFTAVLIVCLWKFDVVISAFQFVLNIVYPFLLGGAIAFALSVPMNFVERKLFTERKISEKYKRKYARGISLMLVITGVTGILAMIIFGLLPQLAGTFANLGKSIQEFIPQVQGWADHWFHNNKEIMNVVNNLEFDWNKIMEAAAGFLKNGAGSVLETTINTAKNIIGAVVMDTGGKASMGYIITKNSKTDGYVVQVQGGKNYTFFALIFCYAATSGTSN